MAYDATAEAVEVIERHPGPAANIEHPRPAPPQAGEDTYQGAQALVNQYVAGQPQLAENEKPYQTAVNLA